MAGEPSPFASVPRRRLLLRMAVGLCFTTLFFWLLIEHLDGPQLKATFARVDGFTLAVGFLIYGLINVIRSRRFLLLIKPLTPWTMFHVVSLHNMALRMLPARLGEVVFAYLVKRAGAGGMAQNLLALLFIRILDATMVIILFAVTFAFNQTVLQGSRGWEVFLALTLATLGLGVIFCFNRLLSVGLRVLSRLAHGLGLDQRPVAQKLLNKLTEAIAAHAALPRALLLPATLYSLILWLATFGLIFFALRAFGFPVTITQAVLGGTAGVVSGFLPISAVGNLGALEAGWALGLVLVGFDPGQAVAASFACSAAFFAYALIFGLVGAAFLLPRRAPRVA